MTRTSEAGLHQLVAEEGEALTAYRDIAGVWTIGVGLTAASGVIVPRAGMRISQAESRRLLAEALSRSYEPAVAKAMPGAAAHEFDGAVSFHLNTGAIGRASWVGAWRRRDGAAVRSGLGLWIKAGGRKVEGLRRRRQREADLILEGRYAAATPDPALRRGMRGAEVTELQRDLIALGLLEAPADGIFGRDTETAVRALQRAHPQLVVDGIAGPATRAQIARALKARTALAGIAAGGAIGTAAPLAATQLAGAAGLPLPMIATLIAVLALVAFVRTAWRFRDEIQALLTIEETTAS